MQSLLKTNHQPNQTRLVEAYNQCIGLIHTVSGYNHNHSDRAPDVLIEIYNDAREKVTQELGIKIIKVGSYPEFMELTAATEQLRLLLEAHIQRKPQKPDIVNLKEIRNFPKIYYDKIAEAQTCYKHNCYAACCVLCGAVWEHLLLNKVKDKSNWAERKEEFCKKYNLSRELNLINQLHTWRTASAHLTSTDFTEEKAKISISALVLAIKNSNQT